ncbi:type II secretion system F family protein [Streptomyces sp. NPDC006544]|uniref:type II secretion system F family protein n=1 Tax=Streptomyces sp. NPDC006544 TaxID=3154583 RepID=UPI0033BE6DF4
MDGLTVHSLGTALCLTAAALCTASAVAARIRERTARRRLKALLAAKAARRSPLPAGPLLRGALAAWAPAAGALVAAWVLIGGLAGVVAGCVAAFGVRRWTGRGRPPSEEAVAVDPRVVQRQLPFAADLLAACLAAGAGPVDAAEVVGESLGGPVGERLATAGAELRLGGEPGAAWGSLARIPGARALAECLERSARTGAPAAEPVSRLAAVLRADRAREAGARAQRAAVLVTAPVGLCFLPAFLAMGVAPVVIGMASGLLAGT